MAAAVVALGLLASPALAAFPGADPDESARISTADEAGNRGHPAAFPPTR